MVFATTGRSGRLFEAESIKEVELFRLRAGDPFLSGWSNACDMLLKRGKHVERHAWAGGVSFGFEAHAHDAVEHQRQKAYQRMGTDTVGQSVMNWRDLDVRFQDAKAPLDIP